MRLYRDHLSDYSTWKEKEHAHDWLIFPNNVGENLSIDEVAISNGELYTIVTNKAALGKKGALVAIVKGTKVAYVTDKICQIPLEIRLKACTITRDLADTMTQISINCFPNAIQIDDRFHVQQLVSEALQEVRIGFRKEAIKEHNNAIKEARKENKNYWPPRYLENDETKKEMLARSRYLLYKSSGKWSDGQIERSQILFREYPILKEAYDLTMHFRGIYENTKWREKAKPKLEKWYSSVEKRLERLPSFETPLETIRLNEDTIINYFEGRLTNASAESFNSKIKGFRSVLRGVADIKFFMYRVSVLFG